MFEKDKPKPEPKPGNGENGYPGKMYRMKKRTEKPMFKKSMETKYATEWGSNKVGSTAKANITDKKTKYLRLGYTQNPRKVEMAKCGAATTKKRGTPAHDLKYTHELDVTEQFPKQNTSILPEKLNDKINYPD